MKGFVKYILIAVLVAWSFQAVAAPRQLLIGQEQHGSTLRLPVDTVAVIELPANASTGYTWKARLSADRTWEVLGTEYLHADVDLPGVWGKERIYVAGAVQGTSAIQLDYLRPFSRELSRSVSYQVQSDGRFSEAFSLPEPEQFVPPKYTPTRSDLPSHYNICENGGCTPVRSQGSCGSCWAFATAAPLEINIKTYDGIEVNLSEQYLVSCNNDGWDCGGGWWAHNWHLNKKLSTQNEAGAVLEEDKPYTGTNGSCGVDYPKSYRLEDWDYVSQQDGVPDVDAIKEALLTYGPLTVGVCAGSGVSNYSGGVYTGSGCTSINHAVALTGWDDGDGAWYMRNSWGTSWGEGGYMRIGYGSSRIGYNAAYVIYQGTQPRLAVNGVSTFKAILGRETPAPQSVTVRNMGADILNWTAVSNQPWLTVSPASGATPTNMTVSVDTTGMPEGIYTANLTLTSYGAVNSPLTVPVEVKVVEVPEILAPWSPTAPTVNGSILPEEYSDATVLDLDPSRPGTFQAWIKHDGQDLYVAVDAARDTDNDDWDVLAVYFDLNNDGEWPTSPSSEGRFYVLSNGTLSYYPVYNPGGGFEAGSRQNDPTGLTGSFGTSNGHRVVEAKINMNTSRLQVSTGDTFGLYLMYYDHQWGDEFDVVGQWPDSVDTRDDCILFGKTTIGEEVTFEDLLVNPASLRLQAVENGSATAPQTLNISGSENGNLTWAAEATEPWLMLTATDGMTPGSLGVWADPTGLAPGVYSGTVTLTAMQSNNGSVSVAVTFEVTAEQDVVDPDFDVEPRSLSFEAVQYGPLPMPQALSIINRGGGVVQWTAAIEEGDWFTLDAFSGTCPSSVQVQILTTDKGMNTHHGAVIFSAPGQEPVRVDLWLTIVEQMGDNHPPGAPVPLSPQDMAQVSGSNIELTVQNAVDPDGHRLTYVFEIYLEGSDTPVVQLPVPEGQGTTTALITQTLSSDTSYRWRAKAVDTLNAQGPWSADAHFQVGETVILGGCGCNTPKGRASGVALLLGLLLALSIPRRRK